MPRTSTLLTREEREQFGRWIEEKREAEGLSRRELLDNLGDNRSTAEISSYLRGKVPTPATLEKLAASLRLPLRGVLLRAGVLRPLLREMADLTASALFVCERDSLEFSDCVVPRKSRKMPRGLCVASYMRAVIPSWDAHGMPFVMPWQGAVAAYLAVVGFPLRGEQRTGNTYMWSADAEIVVRQRGRLPRELAVAEAILADHTMEPDARRAAAGECVRQWARRQYSEFARAIERASYENGPRLPTLWGSGEEKAD